ncbi:PemK-like protein [Trueperella bernardiae]|uniref:PemK-like protein n=2 Tax=Trueperella bernardiae TaxID=59561 RepID=A0A0W1KJ03_9ACTO|nr:PemK-like protein [Trueperella bernardiae]
MSFMESLRRAAKSAGRSLGRDLARKAGDEISRAITGSRGTSGRGGRSASRGTAQGGGSARGARTASSKKNATQPAPGPKLRPRGATLPGPDEPAIEWPVARIGLPTFDYSPLPDASPDPGEVVWAWVPFDENDGRGKDRPVLVLAGYEEHVVFVQMSSKDHDDYTRYEASQGRTWLDIGTGAWDSRGRSSEVRLDRLLVAHVAQVRREGATLDRARYDAVVKALMELHG